MMAVFEGDLFAELRNPEGTRIINDRCRLRTQAGHCIVLISGIIPAPCAAADHMARAHAMVSLVDQGWATQVEVARAFDCSARTVPVHMCSRFGSVGVRDEQKFWSQTVNASARA